MTVETGKALSNWQQIARLLVGLPARKQARLLELLELYGKSDDDQEREEILEAMAEILQRSQQRQKAIRVEELWQGISPEGARGLRKHRRWLARRVRKLRLKRGWSQHELARRSGLPQSHISRLENAKHTPTYLTIEKLARAFGVSPGELDPSLD